MTAAKRWFATAAALILAQSAAAESQRERGERYIRNQEQSWNISCSDIHPAAHRFVAQHVLALLKGDIDASIAKQTAELSDGTLKCFGIEPIARHTGAPFPADFGELHEVLRTAHEYLDSIITNKHPVLRDHNRGELQKRYDELKNGTGRRYRDRAQRA